MAFLVSSHKVEAGEPRDRPKHRSSCATVEEDLAAATAMDGSALPVIDALRSCDAISKAPRAAGYRGSDFVRWHGPVDRGNAPFRLLWGRKPTESERRSTDARTPSRSFPGPQSSVANTTLSPRRPAELVWGAIRTPFGLRSSRGGGGSRPPFAARRRSLLRLRRRRSGHRRCGTIRPPVP
jgi:hypothetical protein